MGILKIHDPSISRETIAKNREQRFLKLTSAEKFYALLNLINISVKLNKGKPLKHPQGKGIIISKS
jgi:hypothetical protein